MSTELRDAIIATSQRLGINPLDLATAISYETAGTFDPWKKGPTTQWGEHRGLIQWGEPQRQKYGVTREMPVGAQVDAAGNYLVDAGVKPGMGLLDVYSAINAGHVGRYNRSDANNGGAPGTVADKVNNQMGAHRQKAEQLLGGADFSVPPSAAPVMGSMAVAQAPKTSASPVPPAVLNAAAAPAGGSKLNDIFGMMAMGGQQGPQFSPVNIQGPSPEQANALSTLIQALKGRIA